MGRQMRRHPDRDKPDEYAEYLEAHAGDTSGWVPVEANVQLTGFIQFVIELDEETAERLQHLANARDMNLIEFMEQELFEVAERTTSSAATGSR
jgi:hypothetical protein